MKHLLKLMDLSSTEITEILNLADQLKYEKKNGTLRFFVPRGVVLFLFFSCNILEQITGLTFQKSAESFNVFPSKPFSFT